jgi:pyruvate/2-oxoglutarate dehydrogenase complex dihydrolipoamide acyltransferase (E2) component
MAKLVGTGEDPLGQYGRGIVFDVPRADPLFGELVAKGYADEVAPEDHPGRDDTQIAAAALRGDALAHPAERAAADRIGARAIDIVHTGDPDAPVGAGSPDPEEVRSHADNLARVGNWDEYGDTPEAAPYLRTASGTEVREGDLATHSDRPAAPAGGDHPNDPIGGEGQNTVHGAAGPGQQQPGQGGLQGGTATTTGGQPGPDGTVQVQGATPADNDPDSETGGPGEDGIDATEGARTAAAEQGIDLADVEGTGADGRITKADVEKHAGQGS